MTYRIRPLKWSGAGDALVASANSLFWTVSPLEREYAGFTHRIAWRHLYDTLNKGQFDFPSLDAALRWCEGEHVRRLELELEKAE